MWPKLRNGPEVPSAVHRIRTDAFLTTSDSFPEDRRRSRDRESEQNGLGSFDAATFMFGP